MTIPEMASLRGIDLILAVASFFAKIDRVEPDWVQLSHRLRPGEDKRGRGLGHKPSRSLVGYDEPFWSGNEGGI